MAKSPKHETGMTIDEAMEASAMFGRLEPRQRKQVAKLMTTKSFEPGTVILRQGTTAVTLYLVLSGRLEVSRASEDGDSAPMVVATLGPGDIFGELALLDDQPRSTSVTTTEQTQCAMLSRWELQKELKRFPDLASALLAMLSRRIREMDDRLARYERSQSVH